MLLAQILCDVSYTLDFTYCQISLSNKTYYSPPYGEGGWGWGFFPIFIFMLKHFFLLLVSIITLASCGDDDPTPSPVIPTTAQNTVFVFMPYTANDSGNNSLYPLAQPTSTTWRKAHRQEQRTGRHSSYHLHILTDQTRATS